ncbi:MAG: PadR family transcriptional regulator [Nanoarchaeota archaeon]|nr:PadR family transcriptional regulator [Nanoarchaeota archaeon]MBU1030555.1 PadR family transcriptional regulator [Nanoarchaeota archaeon]MBU1850538.1 PadR family transcriptional regulator [Nanoarchaeota archaeon]
MTKINVSNMIKFYTLCLLSTGPKHGYEIIKETTTKLDRNVSASQIYPFLKILQKNELIETKQLGKRDKKRYVLTQKGEKFVRVTMNKFGELIKITITQKLSVCAHCGCKLYESGHIEEINEVNLNFCCKHCATAYKEEQSILLTY